MNDDRDELLRRWIPLLTAALFVVPVLLDLAISDHRRAFGYMASDAYYYLNVARHVVHEHRFAFDGEHATNGFHPLWQVTLVPITWLVEVLGGRPHHLLATVVVVNALFIGVALYLLARAVLREAKGSFVVVLLPIGVYGLIASVAWYHQFAAWLKSPTPSGLDILHGTLWSYVNGMESSLVILLFSVVVFLFVTRDVFAGNQRIWFGVALALFVLARLDHVFFAFSILCALFIEAMIRREPPKLRATLVIGGIFAGPLLVYMAINWIGFGNPIPVSGGLKSTFPHASMPNIGRLWACLLQPKQQSYYRLFRVEQAVVPAVVAVAYLVFSLFKRPPTRLASLLVPCAFGVILLATYDYLFVDLAQHGHWYFPASVIFVSLVVIELLGRTALARLPAATELVLAGVVAALVFGAFFKVQRATELGSASANFYFNEVPKIHARYGSEIPKLLENDDGIVSFATGYPAMAGMGLALDPEASRAWFTGQIIPFSVSRGFNRVTSLLYWNAGPLTKESPSEQVGQVIFHHLFIPDIGAFNYSVDYRGQSGFAILKIEPKKN